MSRPLRVHVPGRPYHIVSRGNNKECIFRDDGDYRRFLRILRNGLERFAIQCISYCLMWNHFHLLVIPQQHSVSRLMQQVNGHYCRGWNRKQGRVGHVLQGRFGSSIVDDHAYLVAALRYIALNPVAAGLVRRPEEWRWSSYRAIAGLDPCPSFLRLEPVWSAVNCADAAAGRLRYITYVSGGLAGEELQNALLIGGERLARQVTPLLVPHQENIDYTVAHRFATRPTLETLLRPARDRVELKLAVAEAFHKHAYTLAEIGAFLNLNPSTICRWVRSIVR